LCARNCICALALAFLGFGFTFTSVKCKQVMDAIRTVQNSLLNNCTVRQLGNNIVERSHVDELL
jgi:hypothetical protein